MDTNLMMPLWGIPRKSVDQTSAYVLRFQPGIASEYGFRSVSSGEHTEDVLDGKTPTADDWFSSENSRIDRDARNQRLVHT